MANEPGPDGMTPQQRKDRAEGLARFRGGCDHAEFDRGGWCRRCWASKYWLKGEAHPRPPEKAAGFDSSKRNEY